MANRVLMSNPTDELMREMEVQLQNLGVPEGSSMLITEEACMVVSLTFKALNEELKKLEGSAQHIHLVQWVAYKSLSASIKGAIPHALNAVMSL